MTTEFTKVKTDHNWREVDMDEYGEFISGEHVRVRWPDGSETREVVDVQRSSYSVMEQGGYNTTIPVRRAYITVVSRGAPATVALAGMYVKRLRVPA